MNKKYIKPELEITEISAANIVATSISISSEDSANPAYPGGGDAKILDFEDEDIDW